MAENIPALRDAVEDAEIQLVKAEAAFQDAVDTWRAEFGASIEPAMLAQARRYFERFPAVAKRLDPAAVARLKGNIRGAAADVAKRTSDQIAVEAVVQNREVFALRRMLLTEVATSMKEAIDLASFRWVGWLVPRQTSPVPQAEFLEASDEGRAYNAATEAFRLVMHALSTKEDLQTRLDQAEAVALWDDDQDD